MARFLRTETNSSGGHSKLRPPVVVTPAAVFVARPVEVILVRSTRLGRKAKSSLPTLLPINPGIAYHGPRVKLTAPRSRNPKTHPFLRAPVVVTAASTFVASPIRVHLVRIRPVPTDASVFRPAVVSQAQGPQGGIGIQLAPSSRGKPKSKLSPPAVVTAAQTAVFYGPNTNLAYSRRGKAKSFLRAPVLVFAATLAFGSKPHLAYSRRGRAKSHLFGVVYDARVYEPIAGYLTRPLDRVPRTKSKLGAPTSAPAVVVVYYGPAVHLSRSSRGKPKSRLGPPAVVAPVLARPILVHLAPSRRGIPRSLLRDPVVVGPVLARAIDTTLVRIRPAAVHSKIRRPTDLVDAADLGYTRVHLVYSRRGKAKPHLSPPAVVAPVLARPLLVHLAYSSRGIPKSNLSAPTVVAPVLARAILVHLAPQRRGKAKPFLRPMGGPAVVYAPVNVTLTYSVRGKPKSKLSPPAIVFDSRPADAVADITLVRIRPPKTHPFLRAPVVVIAATPYLRPVDVTLAYSSRGKPKSKLGPPAVVAAAQAYATLSVNLAYSLRGKPRSTLRRPVVVAPVLARPIEITLAPQRRGTPKSKLRLPVVVNASTLARPLLVHLAYSRRGKPLSGLGRPIVLDENTAYPQGPMVQLAYSLRGKAKPILRKPVVVNAQQALARLSIHLTYSLRGKPKYRLAPPTVVFLAVELSGPEVTLVRIRPPRTMWNLGPMGPPAVVYAPIRTHLAYSLRGVPKSKLRLPVFGAPTPQADTTLLVHLAYSRRGTPKSKLRPPTRTNAATPYFRKLPVTLAPQKRGRAKSILRPPIVVNARPIFYFGTTTFAPIPRRKTRSFLRPPVKVLAFIARPEQVFLAPQSRGVPKSILRPPALLPELARPSQIHLAYQSRGKAKSSLRPPAVVRQREAGSTRITLARIRPAAVHSRLRPPAVVGDGVYFRAILVHLAYSRRGKPIYQLTETAIITTECYGDPMCGFDFAAEVCGTDEAATVIGSTSMSDSTSGSDSAATVEGASAARGSVTGDDARREGC